jgi:outer membrane protein
MKKALIASLIAAAFASPLAAGAAEENVGPWLVRLRAINIDPQSSSSGAGAVGLQEDAISVQNRWAPEIDISYFFTKSIALELIATYPQSQPVSLNAPGVYVGGIGNVKHLPPTLLLQYHFNWEGNPFKPYVGAGINFTWFTQSNLAVPLFPGSLPLNVTSTSWGPALQIGADYKLTENWYLNADFKYIWINTLVTSDTPPGPKLVNTRLNIDPMVYGIGIGYRF